MKYTISIVAIEEKETIEEIYVPEKDRQDGDARYVNTKVKKEVTKQIYQQTVEEINLPAIVAVINKISVFNPETDA